MILIVGLGNPGARYEKTRHNLGFRVADLLAERWGFGHYDTRFDGDIGKGRVFGKDVVMLKPHTFMNLSGASVAACANFFKVAPAEIWVIHDDLDLPLGKLRLRVGGSSGGHNGVASVIERLGSPEFGRFRLGIGRPSTPVPIEDYVVQPFGPEEKDAAQDMVVKAADAVEAALKEDLTRAMNLHNR
ncbi:MAG TPA: aminoacyl-tRNA hydrolase [Candidatus Eisenbacteria bacterium]|nr:aminoacyl-tRNA hydrolase [Candidatus Eisenbacteria bacterium]